MTDRRQARENPLSRRIQASEGSASAQNSAPTAAASASTSPSSSLSSPAEAESDRRMRRARFLAELAEARELRKRVAPRRARAAELQARVLRTFRY